MRSYLFTTPDFTKNGKDVGGITGNVRLFLLDLVLFQVPDLAPLNFSHTKFVCQTWSWFCSGSVLVLVLFWFWFCSGSILVLFWFWFWLQVSVSWSLLTCFLRVVQLEACHASFGLHLQWNQKLSWWSHKLLKSGIFCGTLSKLLCQGNLTLMILLVWAMFTSVLSECTRSPKGLTAVSSAVAGQA